MKNNYKEKLETLVDDVCLLLNREYQGDKLKLDISSKKNVVEKQMLLMITCKHDGVLYVHTRLLLDGDDEERLYQIGYELFIQNLLFQTEFCIPWDNCDQMTADINTTAKIVYNVKN